MDHSFDVGDLLLTRMPLQPSRKSRDPWSHVSHAHSVGYPDHTGYDIRDHTMALQGS